VFQQLPWLGLLHNIVPTMALFLSVATMCSNNDPRSCRLPRSYTITDWQTDRHAKAHKVFFIYARAWAKNT
jgi:hypothetical protein